MEIEPVARENLITLAKAFCSHTGTTLGALSRRSAGDPPYFDRLIRKEGTVSTRKYDQLIRWFDVNWPEGLKRPSIQALPNIPPFPLERTQNGTTQRQQKQSDQGETSQGQGGKAEGRRRRRSRGH